MQGDLKYFWVIFNNFRVIATVPKRYSKKFSKLNWEKIARWHLLKLQKYWNCKVFLCLKLITITQLSSLFVLYFWSSYCRCLIKLLMKWTQFINNYQKSTLRGPMKKQFVLHSCFFMYYLGILIPCQIKGSIFLMNVLPDMYICSLRKKTTPLLPEGTVKCIHLAAKQIHRGY